MKLSKRQHQQLRLKNTLITVLILGVFGLVAYISTLYMTELDVTYNASNSLSDASLKLLPTLPEKVTITAYIRQGQPLRTQVSHLVDRYRQHKPDLTLSFVDPDLEPEKTRELNIGPEGVILVEYQGRSEKLSFIDESSLTNALLQLANAKERWVTFLTGHGERSPEAYANFDLSQFSKELSRRKIKAQTLNLSTLPAIPDNSALLVVAAPAVPLQADELAIINSYIGRGGSLLVLTDPDNANLQGLLQELGVKQLPGTVVDSSSTLYRITDPSFVLSSTYAKHPITKGLQSVTLYPVAAAFEIEPTSPFESETLLSSSIQSWTETGAISGKIRFDAQSLEKQGPIAFAYALTRDINAQAQQRIVVVGDGDFLANAYIGNVGNLDMGLRMVTWLIHDDRFIDIPAKTASDKTLQLSQAAVAVMGFGFLIILPIVLIGTGFIIWRSRRLR
ncbi:MAG: GldG family protein [Methylococcales bacterium]|nr:GldG family protein [Methylococcales bacterium]